ncbi:Conserved_hypothetical protein [Hexamita inflata]|uniref:Uncharacterized protein n=1 Tax=Hexamita inflata TaxID=28002 RepID=A0AA86UU09_9EUKA|nr:Conserved hypothetical protein [Hexamita inflata]
MFNQKSGKMRQIEICFPLIQSSYQEQKNLSDNNYRKIEHIQLISFLTNLTELNLQNNNIYDISSISKLKNLTKLDVRRNIIEDISTLQSFTDLIYLTELYLSGNKISDISSISKLKNLKKLNLTRNRIEDISAIQSLLNLTHLHLSYNKLTSYTIALPNLVYLSLESSQLHDTSGLQYSPKLEILFLFKTETTDLRTIPPQLFSLKELDLSQNNLMEISYLSNFVDLQILSLGENQQLQNIGPLKFCTQLTKLDIADSNVSDIWPLQLMKNLKTLEMAHTKVVDLHPLQHLNKLEGIYAYGTSIIDVSPLSKLTKLNSLVFSCNKITNAETLKHPQIFSEFNFSDQQVPKTDELKFYNKRLSVHCSHKQVRRIQNENRTSKFRESMTHQKESINLKINEQILAVNMKIEIYLDQ